MRSFTIAALVGVASANMEAKFLQYITEHAKSYGTREEFEFRLARFAEADAEIEALNADVTQTATFAHNHLSDWTETELQRIRGAPRPENHEQTITFAEPEENSWTSINWVKKGKVYAVQDQGSCGSCWAFSTVSCMESANAIHTGSLKKLSEQQLVDCSSTSSYGNHGCSWGYGSSAYDYAVDHRMESEKSYPYKGYE